MWRWDGGARHGDQHGRQSRAWARVPRSRSHGVHVTAATATEIVVAAGAAGGVAGRLPRAWPATATRTPPTSGRHGRRQGRWWQRRRGVAQAEMTLTVFLTAPPTLSRLRVQRGLGHARTCHPHVPPRVSRAAGGTQNKCQGARTRRGTRWVRMARLRTWSWLSPRRDLATAHPRAQEPACARAAVLQRWIGSERTQHNKHGGQVRTHTHAPGSTQTRT